MIHKLFWVMLNCGGHGGDPEMCVARYSVLVSDVHAAVTPTASVQVRQCTVRRQYGQGGRLLLFTAGRCRTCAVH